MAEGRIEIDTGTSELLCEIRDRVALITLNRPEARNALFERYFGFVGIVPHAFDIAAGAKGIARA